MLSTGANTRLYTYTEHEGAIHEFQFWASSPAAVDEWFTLLKTLQCQNGQKGEPKRLLLNLTRSGILPMTYAIQRARQFVAQHPELDQVRVAIVHGADFPVELVRAFSRVMYLKIDLELRYFPAEKRQRALAWLHDG
jgi:hypothetical protein